MKPSGEEERIINYERAFSVFAYPMQESKWCKGAKFTGFTTTALG